MRRSDQLRVLVLSRNYPNNVTSMLGLWVRAVVRESAKSCTLKVISPVPYCPPLPRLPENYARFRRVARRSWDSGIEVIHPRMIVGPGRTTFGLEWLIYLGAIRSTVRRLYRDFPFDLIHAHFAYPDGVVAARLARQYRVPFVISEHNSWLPWMRDHPGVRRRSSSAVRQCAWMIAMSESVRKSVEHFTGPLDRASIIPNGVDASQFPLRADDEPRDAKQLLFVGIIRPVKGVDVLLTALRALIDRGRPVRLVLVGEAFYKDYQQEEQRLKRMVVDLHLERHVHFAGKQVPPQLGQTMRQSAMLVLPSRIEAFGVVLIEALASGTPVVATRSGGPEDIVTDDVGVLVPCDDADALARGIERVLDRPDAYDPQRLRAHALENFGLESVGKRVAAAYEGALGSHARFQQTAE